MMENKVFKSFIYILIAACFFVMLTACGGSQGIREPLLEPQPDVSQSPNVGTNNFAIIRGNYFLLASNCPHDDSALQVAQEQESLFMRGGFIFGDKDEFLVGFVDENAKARFFGDENTSRANCTAMVEGMLMHGTCTYREVLEDTSCRFVYGRHVEGLYNLVWNDCESNDFVPLEIEQVGNEVTLINGFDYMPFSQIEEYDGVIENGQIAFNIDILNPRGGYGADDEKKQYNCEATVSENLLTGRCRDLTVNPATICTFGYDNPLRIAGVDLSDDSLFPSPAITPGPISVVIDITGTYARVSNDCEDDEGNIQIVQEGVSLGLLGGFDYQAVDPDLYSGTISSNGAFAFSVLGPTERAFCSADVAFSTQGILGFGGSCDVIDSNGAPVETCEFSYSRL